MMIPLIILADFREISINDLIVTHTEALPLSSPISSVILINYYYLFKIIVLLFLLIIAREIDLNLTIWGTMMRRRHLDVFIGQWT